MRRIKTKLAVILALAAILALAVAGSAGAALPFASVTETLLPGLTGSSSSSSEPEGATTNVVPPATSTPTTPSTTTPTVPQCADGSTTTATG